MISETEHQFALMDGMQMAVPYPDFLVNVMVIAWSGFFVVAFLCLFRPWRGRYVGVLKYFVDILTCTFSGTAIAWSIRQCLALPAEWQGHRPDLGTVIAFCVLICLALFATNGQHMLRKLFAVMLCSWFAMLSSVLGSATTKLLAVPAALCTSELTLCFEFLLANFISTWAILSINGKSYMNVLDRAFESQQNTRLMNENGESRAESPNDELNDC